MAVWIVGEALSCGMSISSRTIELGCYHPLLGLTFEYMVMNVPSTIRKEPSGHFRPVWTMLRFELCVRSNKKASF